MSKYFKDLKIHASTQLTTHNEGQIKFLSKLAATRVNLSRELNIDEIKTLTLIGHNNNILTEVFVHGSYCISFSGICYLSSVHGGTSGNRGRCSQPCRDRYLTTPKGKKFPLNLKDNSAFFDLREISDAGVDSLKIEGRIKKFDYVYMVVNSWKKQIQSFNNKNRLNNDNSDLYKVFNREFSNSFLQGDINKNMFIDNPRVSSIQHPFEINNHSRNDEAIKDKTQLYEEKIEIKINVKNKIKSLSIAKSPLMISISGGLDTPLKVSVKTPYTSFVVLSESNLVKKQKSTTKSLNHNFLFERLRTLNNTGYHIEHIELDNLQKDLFIPIKELHSIKKRISFLLNGSKEVIDPIDVPVLKKQDIVKITPALSLLISSQEDLCICNKTSANIYFQLPNSFKNKYSEFIELFLKNRQLIPWFPSILIGENYDVALEFLQQVQPKLIVTNNTGIAYEAYKKGIFWIAGPYLNTVNSFSLLCLKENFNCYGSFVSNEINKDQIKSIINPENFKLYYSIYHPILLMSSRQCLFHQVIGCTKSRIDEKCIQKCKKFSSITNLKKVSLYIEKTEGNYHSIYNNNNFLNADIVTDIPGIFSGFCIDLRNIKTETKIEVDKSKIIKLFENLLNGNPDSKKELKQTIHPTTNAQYKKGI